MSDSSGSSRRVRAMGVLRWVQNLGFLALLVAVVLLAIPQTGVREMVANETSPEYRAVDRRMRSLEESLARQTATLQQLREENERLRAVAESTYRPARPGSTATRPAAEPGFAVRLYPVPERVAFLGEELPLDRPDVHQRFEEEWTRFLVNRHWSVKWYRRARSVFPLVEQKLAAAGLPDDLKYVLVIESGVEARATSSAGAEGWWQFMQGTGKEYGLERSDHIDQRRDLALATDAALRHFADLYETFGSWPLVLSAYNAGERRVRQSMEEQGETSFYDLVLPTETEAYWFKAAAAKLLLESPERYQLELSDDRWAPIACDTLEIRVFTKRLDLRTLTASSDLTYRGLKELNPWVRRSYLPSGHHRLVVPAAYTDAVVASLEGAKLLRRGDAEEAVLAEGESAAADEPGEDDAPNAVRVTQDP